MHLKLRLNAELEARLKEQAAMAGRQPEEFALEALQEKLAAEGAAPSLSTDDWLRQFDSWVGNQVSRNPHVDDSRESIYADGR